MYNREAAVEYAHRWAFGRNPAFFDYSMIGGDCTAFASQVLFAGGFSMNLRPVFGWYYIDANNKSPSWTGVNELYNFLISNRGAGPRAVNARIEDMLPGDLIQLDFDCDGRFDHTPVIVDVGEYTPETMLVAAHTIDSDYRPISTYNYCDIRFLHII